MGSKAGPREEEVWVSRSGVAAGTSEQVETTESGIFCAVLNIAQRELGLSHHPVPLPPAAHGDSLETPRPSWQQKQWCEGREAMWAEGGGIVKPWGIYCWPQVTRLLARVPFPVSSLLTLCSGPPKITSAWAGDALYFFIYKV